MNAPLPGYQGQGLRRPPSQRHTRATSRSGSGRRTHEGPPSARSHRDPIVSDACGRAVDRPDDRDLYHGYSSSPHAGWWTTARLRGVETHVDTAPGRTVRRLAVRDRIAKANRVPRSPAWARTVQNSQASRSGGACGAGADWKARRHQHLRVQRMQPRSAGRSSQGREVGWCRCVASLRAVWRFDDRQATTRALLLAKMQGRCSPGEIQNCRPPSGARPCQVRPRGRQAP